MSLQHLQSIIFFINNFDECVSTNVTQCHTYIKNQYKGFVGVTFGIWRCVYNFDECILTNNKGGFAP